MMREAPRRHEHRVDPDDIAVAHVARQQGFGGADDAAQAIVVERERCPGFGRAGRDLDEGERRVRASRSAASISSSPAGSATPGGPTTMTISPLGGASA